MATKTIAEEDQKKRTLEALERRFAAAKAQAQPESLREKQRRRVHPFLNSASSAAAAAAPSVEAFVPNTPSSSKKELEVKGLTYSSICQPVHENLLIAVEISNKDKTAVDKILHELLQNGDSAQKYIQGSRNIKLDNWILLDNFVQGKKAFVARSRALQANSKRSKKHMSMKQLKKCRLLELPLEQYKFELFMPMHEMWKNYVMQHLKNIGKNHVAQSLLVADLHGAILRVVECKIDFFIGMVGIMIRETAETFGIITQENNFRVVPKKKSVFIFQADSWKITLDGDKCRTLSNDI